MFSFKRVCSCAMTCRLIEANKGEIVGWMLATKVKKVLYDVTRVGAVK